MEAQSVTISLHDVSRGFEVSPERVPLAVLSDFSRDVEELLRGDGKQLDTDKLEVAVIKGSLAIQTQPLSAIDFAQDIARLLQSQLIDGLHTKRREVIARWQKLAKTNRAISFKIAAGWLAQPVIISADSDFRSDDADQWVRVERYMLGEIYDLGGKQVVNAHMLLPDGKTIKVETTKDTIRGDKLNRLYKPAMVRIKAEYNVLTREYRNAQLLEFVEHDSKLDEQAMARLTERGAVAWKDVPNASQWVDDLRGGLV
jgi:hypothetical protein